MVCSLKVYMTSSFSSLPSMDFDFDEKPHVLAVDHWKVTHQLYMQRYEKNKKVLASFYLLFSLFIETLLIICWYNLLIKEKFLAITCFYHIFIFVFMGFWWTLYLNSLVSIHGFVWLRLKRNMISDNMVFLFIIYYLIRVNVIICKKEKT